MTLSIPANAADVFVAPAGSSGSVASVIVDTPWVATTLYGTAAIGIDISGTTDATIGLEISVVDSSSASVDLSSQYCFVQNGQNSFTASGSVTTVATNATTASCTIPFPANYALKEVRVYVGTTDGTTATGAVGQFYLDINRLYGSGGGSNSLTPSEAPTPAKYSGPEFSGLSGMGIMTGSTGKLEGKRLDQISSIEIGGEAATFTATSATELELSLPAGLAPGRYDLVINSSAGKLTHINAIQVREPRRAFSITTRSEGRISEEQYQEHAIISSMQIPELNKVRCIVNGSNLAQAKAQAERLCALVALANPNIETTVVESRSTVKNRTVYARVTYGWN